MLRDKRGISIWIFILHSDIDLNLTSQITMQKHKNGLFQAYPAFIDIIYSD